MVQLTFKSSSLLPFLYITRTLLSHPPRVSSSHGAKANPYSRQFACLHSKQAPDYKVRHNHDIPFEADIYVNPDIPLKSSPALFNSPSKASTITRSEKATFERIFKDLSQTAPNSSLSAKPDSEEALDAEAEADALDTYGEFSPMEDLNTIFDAAIRELRFREESSSGPNATYTHKQYEFMNRERAIDTVISSPAGWRTIKRPLRMSIGNSVVLSSGIPNKGTELRLAKAAQGHQTRVSRLLERAETDVELWRILDEEVFKVVKDLSVNIEEDRQAREKEMEVEEARTKAEGGKLGMHLVRGKIQSNEEFIEREVNMALATNELFVILQENYAEYLLRALRLLRQHHPTSDYASCLLPTIKSLGPISYVLGTSPGLYNELLFLKWTQYSDLHGMADLLQEMMDKGIETNAVTMVLLTRLRRLRRHGIVGKMGLVVQQFWQMRGTQEGWRRIVGLEIRAKEESQRKTRASLTAGRESLAEIE